MSDLLEIKVLGPASVCLHGEIVTGFSSQAAEILLYYLVCNPGQHARDTLAELLWSDRDRDQARANLRSSLSSLRAKVGDRLVTSRVSISFDHESQFELDSTQFEAQLIPLIEQTRHVLTAEQAAAVADSLKLYTGDFLADLRLPGRQALDEWLLLNRERYRRTAVRGLWLLIDHLRRHRDYAQGLHWAERLVAIDGLDERASVVFMDLALRCGQPQAARTRYQALRQQLTKALGLEPGQQPQALLGRAQTGSFPPPLELPESTDEFVGRKADLDALAPFFTEDESRLLSLVGPGGIGKSRLASEAARQNNRLYRGQFLDGVHFVPLAGVDTVHGLLQALAQTFALQQTPAAALEDQVLNLLAEKEALLILDNFEQLLPAGSDPAESAADLLDLLIGQAAGLHVIVTSRERLNIPAETVYEVSGLLDADDAHDLFIQRAAEAQPDFKVTSEERQVIARITTLLVGSPLAIGLAASWTASLSCTEIETQLIGSLDLLQHPSAGPAEANQNLRTVFDASWALLSQTEQEALVGCSTFSGRFDLDAAAYILDVAAIDLRFVLGSLLDKSLLQAPHAGRFDFHPFIREFASQIAAKTPEQIERTASRHAEYFSQQLLTASQGLETADFRIQLETLERAQTDIRQAWYWLSHQRRFSALATIANPLFLYHDLKGDYHQGLRLFSTAIEQLSASENSPENLRHHLAARQAIFQMRLGHNQDARETLEHLISLPDVAESPEAHGFLLRYLSEVLMNLTDYPRSMALAQEAVVLQTDQQQKLQLAHAHQQVGRAARFLDWDQVRSSYQAALDLYRQMGYPPGILDSIGGLANTYARVQEFERAFELRLEALDMARSLGVRRSLVVALTNVGHQISLEKRAAQGDSVVDQAMPYFEEALAHSRLLGDPGMIGISIANMGEIYREAQRPEVARRYYLESEPYLRRATLHHILRPVLLRLGAISIELKDYDIARGYLTEVEPLFEAAGESEMAERAAELLRKIPRQLLPDDPA
jgi:predicted ATPase/DNA-binding SARP family transcriptional activator